MHFIRSVMPLMLAAVGFAGSTAFLAAQNPSSTPSATRPAPAATRSGAAEAYQLVWADEFNKDGPLDSKDWNFEQGFVRNQELQWYQEENARCADGMLVIEARREKKPNPRYEAGSSNWQTSRKEIEYTAASVTTSRKHQWLYGRFEIRARINTDKGSWPAFWMLGNGRWPACGEVDIMEYYRDMLLANVGWMGENGRIKWNSVRKPMTEFPKDWSNQFHVWRMDWDEKRMDMYVDGTLINSQDLSKTLNGGNQTDNPFHRPMYLLLNQAIGGQNGGDPSATKFPLRYEIDYVRVYQTPSQIQAQATAASQPLMRRGR